MFWSRSLRLDLLKCSFHLMLIYEHFCCLDSFAWQKIIILSLNFLYLSMGMGRFFKIFDILLNIDVFNSLVDFLILLLVIAS